MSFVRFTFWGLIFLCLIETRALSAEKVPRLQVRLIRASSAPPETSDPKVLMLNAQLKADFGFNCYQQIFFTDAQFIRDEKMIFELPDDFGITITYLGCHHAKREYFVETSYRGKKFVGFVAAFPEPAKPVLIRGPGTNDYRYIIALTPG